MAVRDKISITNNETYFITFTVVEWRRVFINDDYCALVWKWFDYMRREYGNKIYGYVIMPNHVHCLLKLSGTSPIVPKLIQNGKRFLSYGIVAQLEKDGKKELLEFFAGHADKKDGAKHKIFKKRYDSLIIESRKFFLQKLNYIHNNPCQEKWGLAENPEDYRYSSAANYVLGKGAYPVDLAEF